MTRLLTPLLLVVSFAPIGRAEAADKLAWRRALRPKLCKLAMHGQLRQAVAAKLERNWSPEQIAGWLKRTHPGTEACQVSHETIYRSLYVQARGVLKKELMLHLRSRRSIRRSRHATQKGRQIANAVSIRTTPVSKSSSGTPSRHPVGHSSMHTRQPLQ